MQVLGRVDNSGVYPGQFRVVEEYSTVSTNQRAVFQAETLTFRPVTHQVGKSPGHTLLRYKYCTCLYNVRRSVLYTYVLVTARTPRLTET